MPSKTWVRRRVPSTTWKWTRTRSPGANRGTPLQLALLDALDDRAHGLSMGADAGQPAAHAGTRRGLAEKTRDRRAAQPANVAEALSSPASAARRRLCSSRHSRTAGVVARRAGPRAPPSPGRWPAACSADTRARRSSASEKDSSTALSASPERAGQLAEHGVGDHHRRQLAAREHVAADRDGSVGEVLARPARRRPRSGRRAAPACGSAASSAASASSSWRPDGASSATAARRRGRRRRRPRAPRRRRRPAAPFPRRRRRASRRPGRRRAASCRGS